MTMYTVSSFDGSTVRSLGSVEAPSVFAALDFLAMEAGFCSHSDLCAFTGEDPDGWTEDRTTFERGGAALLLTPAA